MTGLPSTSTSMKFLHSVLTFRQVPKSSGGGEEKICFERHFNMAGKMEIFINFAYLHKDMVKSW